MKKLFTLFILFTFAGIVQNPALVPSLKATAQTTSTRYTEKLRLTNEDGTVYLTTEAVPVEQPADQADSTAPRRGRSLTTTPIIIPEGFAQDFSTWINAVLSWVMVISALLVFFYLIWGGFDWITSGGDKGRTDKAREKIMAAVIGLIIVAASYAVVNLVVRFLGFSGLNDVFTNVRTIDGRGQTPLLEVVTPSPTPTTTR